MVETETIRMKLKEKNAHVRSRISTLLYVVAAIVAVFGIAMLAVNIYIFKSTISQYVAQGYPTELVMQSLVPSQLLPGIFEPIALYGGMAFVLIGVGFANSKLAAYFTSASATEENTIVEEEDVTAILGLEDNNEAILNLDTEEPAEDIVAEEAQEETKNV